MKCPLCSKEYPSNNDLDKHLKKIHNTDLKTVKKLSEKPKLVIRFTAEDIEGD